MLNIIDRRGQGGKSHGNVDRFKRRYDKYIRQAAKDALEKAGITGDTKGMDIHIPEKDMSEPVFSHGDGGVREIVHPGNKEYYKGDKIPKPAGGGGSSGSGNGNGNDNFIYHVDSKTIENIWFGDLALPLSLREHIVSDKFKFHRAGIVSSGTPNNRDIVRTARAAIGRRRVQNNHIQKELGRLLEAFEQAADQEARDALLPEIERLQNRHAPYLDPMDERFRNRVKEPVKESRAVMFAMMDVSQSMDENAKYMSRLYFTFLYRFLRRHYERVEVVFMRYHTTARICETAEDFFNGKDTGGTSVANALDLMDQTVQTKYDPSGWDVFAAQAGDGDLGIKEEDKVKVAINNIMSYCRYFTNLVVAPKTRTKELQTLYHSIEDLYGGRLASRQAAEPNEILPVFRELFKAKTGIPLTQTNTQGHVHSFGMPAAAP